MEEDSERFQNAVRAIDAVNADDPKRESAGGVERPKELLYSERMTAWLAQLQPDASPALRLAVRAQHIARWKIPRSDYPRDRAGYRRWRSDLGRFHAETAAGILRLAGYGDEAITRTRELIEKRRLKADPECQTLEDVACLVFLEYHLDDFAVSQSEEKLVNILRRTWLKMSEQGREAALKLDLAPAPRALIEKALAG